MSPWVKDQSEPAHVCSPPRWWLRRRRHPNGSTWECGALIYKPGSSIRDQFGRSPCERRWVLYWDPAPEWSREWPLTGTKPATPPPGPSGVSVSPDGAR